MASDPLSMAPAPPADPPQSRTDAFRAALAAPVIDLPALKALVAGGGGGGVPEGDPSLRALTWQLLMGYLPVQRGRWAAAVARKEAEYSQFCAELVVDPRTLGRPPAELAAAAAAVLAPAGGSSPLRRTTVAPEDHPLSTADTSRWRAFFADAEVRDQIARDVDRTHPDLNFFSGATPAAAAHRAALRRSLFIFAKLNPGLRYVQGMNELMAVLLHTFAIAATPNGAAAAPPPPAPPDDDPDAAPPSPAEAAAFYCFVDLLAEFRDHFCAQLDNSDAGIRATLGRLSAALRGFDPGLAAHLEGANGVHPQFYAFRWITTLLTQEFSFPDAVRLWDALLADPRGRGDALERLCLAMVMLVREELLAGDFAANMKLLQGYPPGDVAAVARRAAELATYKTVIVMDEWDE